MLQLCIWQDGPIPLMNALETNFFVVHPTSARRSLSRSMTPRTPMRPQGFAGDRIMDQAYSPLLKYEWALTYEALCLCAGNRWFAL